MEENKKKIMGTLEENVAYMNEVLPVKESFDLVQRDIVIGGKKSSFFFIDGFTKDDTMLKIMTSFFFSDRRKNARQCYRVFQVARTLRRGRYTF